MTRLYIVLWVVWIAWCCVASANTAQGNAPPGYANGIPEWEHAMSDEQKVQYAGRIPEQSSSRDRWKYFMEREVGWFAMTSLLIPGVLLGAIHWVWRGFERR